MGDNSSGQLKSYVERVERLSEEKDSIASDIKDIYAEAKSSGFDVKALRAIVKMRREDAQKRAEHQAMVDMYLAALGELATTPLGQAAMQRATASA